MPNPLTVVTVSLDGRDAPAAAMPASAAAALAALTPDVVCLQAAPSPEYTRSLWAYLGRQQGRLLRVASTEITGKKRGHLAIIHTGTRRVAGLVDSPEGQRLGLGVLLLDHGVVVVNATDAAPAGALAAAGLPHSGPLLLCAGAGRRAPDVPAGLAVAAPGIHARALVADEAGEFTAPGLVGGWARLRVQDVTRD